MTKAQTPTFRTMMKSAMNAEVVTPLLRNSLYDPDFKAMTVELPGFTKRPADDWFWPSTHPGWGDRMLHTYLTAPESLDAEPFDPTSTMAVTAGTFFHSFFQQVMVQDGILRPQPECGCGRKHPEGAELFVSDPEVKSRGHIDGVLFDDSLWELKTMNPQKFWGIPKESPSHPAKLQWLKDKDWGYYLQAQEYLRMSGAERTVMTIAITSYPFDMTEIHIPYDRLTAMKTRDKYERVRQAVADGLPPRCDCGPKFEMNAGCPSRVLCHGSAY